jgi:hypothetical protein
VGEKQQLARSQPQYLGDERATTTSLHSTSINATNEITR